GVADADLIRLGDDALVGGVLHAAPAAYQSGVCRWALDTAVDYAKVRTQFGSAIGSFQAVKHICADMLCRSEQVTSVAWDLVRAVDSTLAGGDGAPEQLELSALCADVIVAQAAPAVAKDCIQVLGGIGFTFEHPAHLYLRSALGAAVTLGHAHRQSGDLARAGLGGARRAFEVDLSAVDDQRDKVRADVAHIAEATGDERRRRLAESGYLMPHWPAPYGLSASPALQLLIDAEFDAAGVVRPDLVIAGWAIPTILQHGTDAQRRRFVAPTLAGDIVWCQMFSEPEAGSDLASLRTKAVRVDGGWRLTGQKIWTSQAHNAQWAICLARTNVDVAKHKGITYFLVDMTSPGLDVRPLREATGHPKFNEVFLDGVFVPDDCVVGDVDGGWRLARTTLANERVAMGGSGLGKEMEALLRQIDGLGRDLTDGELHTFGRLFADSHVGRVLDARAVTAQLAGLDPGAVSSVRKLIGVQHRQSVPDFALELSGVDGLTWPDSAEQVIQNRCLSIAGGTTQILRTAAAERILGMPRG
ncbi:MAG: acyl-CoA dehydrogenase family protein, partial [Gordonia amarae]